MRNNSIYRISFYPPYARLFVDAQNLFCITNYTGADPETDNSYSSYPNQRTFSFGIDLTF